MARKQNLSPEELAEARALLAEVRRDLRELIAFIETRIARAA
jgi:hypothetical protein